MNETFDFFFRLLDKVSDYVLLFVCAMAITLLLTPLWRSFAKRIGMVDKPDLRRINKVPIPRGGGVAIVVSVITVLWVATITDATTFISPHFTTQWLLTYTVCTCILTAVGLADDARGLPALVKLGGQVTVASIFFFCGIHFGRLIPSLPGVVNYALTVFWIVGAINAFNLIDGLDGLATGLALIASFGLAGSLLFENQATSMIPYLIFAGACLGFLRYNFNPASIFLGDTGSMFLGMTLATFPLVSGSERELVVSLGMPVLVMGIPILDTFLAIVRRSVRAMLSREKSNMAGVPNQGGGVLMQPDRDHLHHRLLRMLSNNQRKVVWVFYGISVVLVCSGLVSILLDSNKSPGLFMVVFIVFITMIFRYFDCVELWDAGQLLSRIRVIQRKVVLVPLSILIDQTLCFLAFLFCWYFFFVEMPNRQALLNIYPFYAGALFVMEVLARIYMRVWSRARVRDFFALFFSILIGVAVATGSLWLCKSHLLSLVRFSFLLFFLLFVLLFSVRVWRDALFLGITLMERHFRMRERQGIRILVYGAGMTMRSFLRVKVDREPRGKRMVVGVVDDDPALKGRFVAGFDVLGDGATLETIVRKYEIRAIVITCDIRPENRRNVLRIAEKYDLSVTEWIEREMMLSKNTDCMRDA